MILKSLDHYVGYNLVEAAKSAAKKLRMKFKEHKAITKKDIENKASVKDIYYRINGKKGKYEIRSVDKYENYESGGYYNYSYTLYREENLMVGTYNYARWNKFDEIVELKHSTELYVEDDLTKAIFDMLKEK